MRIKFFVIAYACLFLGGCQNQMRVDPDVDFSHVYPETPPQAQIADNHGSIYAQGFRMNLFGNARQWAVGDLITVTVNESANVDTKASNKAGRKANSSVDAPKILGMLPHVGEVALDMSLATDNNYEGEYNQKQTQKISFQITTTVARVLSNGNLVLKGEKEFYNNGTKEFMCLRGIARPDDIFANNTVEANRLGDLKIQVGQDGQLFKGADAGWLTKLLSLVYPF